MNIKQIEHINQSTINKHGLNPEETKKLLNKFYTHKSHDSNHSNGTSGNNLITESKFCNGGS